MGLSSRLFNCKTMIRILAASVLLSAAAVSADWSGTGIVTCYGHAEVTADFPDGASNEGQGSVHCVPVEWVRESGFGDVMPTTTCTGAVWYKMEDMGAGFCTPNKEKNWSGCGIVHCNGDIYCNDC